jgi:transcriptional regulator with XRE-family HTH domain
MSMKKNFYGKISIMELNKFFMERLKSARQQKGLTQDQLSKLTGINIKLISKYEQGVTLPGIDNLQKLVIALEISADYLLLPQATPKEVPKINDSELYERYFVLEKLEKGERESALLLLNSLIAKQKLKELTDSI